MSLASQLERERLRFENAMTQGAEALRTGQLAAAVAQLREALELDPGNARVLSLLGLAYFRGGNFSEALPVYQLLVNRTPADASAKLNLGLVQLKLGDADAAIATLEASRSLDPSQGRAVSYLGLAYARAGRFVDAYRAFLLAGQHELAQEVEANLTEVERHAVAASVPQPTTSGLLELPPLPASGESSPAAVPDAASPDATVTAAEPVGEVATDAETSDSAQFVRQDPVVVADDIRSSSRVTRASTAISRAVAQAAPATAAMRGQMRKHRGVAAPQALSEFATDDLVRPDEQATPFGLGPGRSLTMRLAGARLWHRRDGILMANGELQSTPATRRLRGQQSDEPFAANGRPFYVTAGDGFMLATLPDTSFAAVELDDDILYLREDVLYAFTDSLRWENGNIPGLRGVFSVVQFRGDGAVVLASAAPLAKVKVTGQGSTVVELRALAGWIGRIIPRAMREDEGGTPSMVACAGEGVLLLDLASSENRTSVRT